MHEIPHDAGFHEVGDRCWVARFELLDVNVGLVAGDRGLLVIDTHASESRARHVVEQVRRLDAGEVVGVVNTHDHFDHTFGNIVFVEEYAAPPVYAHEAAAEALAVSGPALQQEAASEDDPRSAEFVESRLLIPTETFSSAKVVDLGNRAVELVHPGRGHTAGDIVVRVGDADVLFAGDLVEESAARNGVPGFGKDCFPLEWPASLDMVVGLLTEHSTVVPGHGLPVDREFVEDQRTSLGVVAETIRDLAGRGVALDDALDAAEWPYPREELRHAVRRGYTQLPRAARSLPLA